MTITVFGQNNLTQENHYQNIYETHTSFVNSKSKKEYKFLQEQKEKEVLKEINSTKSNPKVACNKQDSLALVALYKRTDGANWYNRTSWLKAPVYKWYGVHIDNTGRVIFLDLSYNQLHGYIPAGIGNLTKLDTLSLQGNWITGFIPSQIGNLTNLTYLNLGGDGLSGSIPAEIGNLTKLTYLGLYYAQFSGSIPTEIGNLTRLTRLYLNNNQFSGSIPTEIGNLTRLTRLYLNNNKFSGSIPAEITNLTKLSYLDLSHNQFSGSISSEIWNENSLENLFLAYNHFSGSIPSEIAKLTNLKNLDLSHNLFTGSIPSEIWNMNSLKTLVLANNQFIGSIPAEIGNLTNLSYLDLSNINLSGSIPSEIWNLKNLKNLNLSHNQFTGSIPAEIENLKNLENLNLSSNHLSGSIPSEISNLTKLNYLYLSDNHLSDTIPLGISKLIELYGLYLNDNNFTTIMCDLSNIPKLYKIRVENNYFDFVELGNLNIPSSKRRFTYAPQHSVPLSKAPQTNGDMKLSINVDGSGNVCQWYNKDQAISGATSNEYTIPASSSGIYYCEITNSTFPKLTLHSVVYSLDNEITNGVLTKDYNALKKLYQSTDGNNWKHKENWMTTENVEKWYGIRIKGYRVLSINLSYDSLNGVLPTELGDLDSLTYLNLNNNDITGTIPKELNNLKILNSIYFYNNKLEGNIPDFSGLNNLQILSLNNNKLTGKVPQYINNMKNLKNVYLSYNKFDKLPVFSFYKFSNFYVNNNKLDFGDLEPNIFIASYFRYTQQANIGDTTIYNFENGKTYTFKAVCGGTLNYYQWFKNGDTLKNQTNSTLTINNATTNDKGVYICKITNPIAQRLTLETNPFIIETVTGLNNISSGFKIYPNPSTGLFYINSGNTKIQDIQAFGMDGKQYEIDWQKGSNSLKINTKGLFLIKIITENGKSFSEKVIIK